MHHWLVKTEPESYSIEDLRRDGVSDWDGVRNPLAQQYMRQMELGDQVFIYHTGKSRSIVGLAEVVKEGYLDPADIKARSVCVDFKYIDTLRNPISLAQIKANSKLREMTLVRMSRLSVMPVTRAHGNLLLKMAEKED